jgi:three-Cys-motif partner protein
MDTSQTIQEHSKEKLAIFKNYLTNYLSVMSNVKYYKNIYIWDIFAGSGTDKHGNDGSSIIAAKIINDFRKNYNKNIFLIANELNKDSYKKLEKNFESYKNYIQCRNYSASKLIQSIIQNTDERSKAHHMFFIDPHGYTQCSVQELKNLFNMKHSDYLIFMPISHVYRFVKIENNAANNFVKDLGVNIKKTDTPYNLIKKITVSLKNNADTNYVYSYTITNREKKSNKYVLFFISKHQLGAEKFLEAKRKIKDSLQKQNLIFDFYEIELKELLSDFLKQEKTNHEIFDFGIQNGFLSKDINKSLKKLYKNNKLTVNPTPSNNRIAFYLKDKNKTIGIKIS